MSTRESRLFLLAVVRACHGPGSCLVQVAVVDTAAHSLTIDPRAVFVEVICQLEGDVSHAWWRYAGAAQEPVMRFLPTAT